MSRDERRFKQADQENKGYLSKDDLTAFLHPEEYDHMKDMVIMETIEDIDKDSDGKISLTEYIGGKYFLSTFLLIFLFTFSKDCFFRNLCSYVFFRNFWGSFF